MHITVYIHLYQPQTFWSHTFTPLTRLHGMYKDKFTMYEHTAEGPNQGPRQELRSPNNVVPYYLSDYCADLCVPAADLK
jgi:hypothetical protein